MLFGATVKVEEEAELPGVFIEAARRGDWRAAEALLMRVFGKPEVRLEVSQPQSVEDVESATLAEIRHLRSVVERTRTRAGARPALEVLGSPGWGNRPSAEIARS